VPGTLRATRAPSWQGPAAIGALLLLVLFAFAPALGGYFLSDAFEANLLLRDGSLDLGALAREFVSPWFGVEGHRAYRPLLSLQYALDYALFGAVPFGYHLGNVLLHALASLLVLVTVRTALPSRGWLGGFLAATVFAIHPARAEAVSWIPGRVSSTSGCLAMASVALAVVGWRRGSRGLGAASILLFALSLLAKEEAVVVPLLVFVALAVAERGDGAPLRAAAAEGARRVVPHLVVLAAYLLWRKALLGSVFGGSPETGEPLAPVAGYLATLPGKLRALFLPVRPDLGSRDLLLAASAVAFVAAPAAGLLLGRRTRARGALCLVGALLALAPTFPVVVRDHFGGARTLYLAAVPLAFALALAIPPVERRTGFAAGHALLLAEAFLLFVPLHLLAGENARWREGWETARDFVREADRAVPPGSAEPLALFSFPYEAGGGGIPVFNTNAVECALQRPYVARDLPVVNLIQGILGPLDAAPLRAIGEVTSLVVAWDGRARRLRDLPPAPGSDLFLDPTEASGDLGSGLEWTFEDLDPREAAVLEVSVRAEGDIDVLAAWNEPDPRDARLDRAHLFEVEPEGPSRRFALAIGNHAGWVLREATEGGIRRLRLGFRGAVSRIEEIHLRGSLPVLPLDLPASLALPGASGWALPFAPPGPGAYRLVWMSPGETRSMYFDAADVSEGRIALDAESRRILAFLPRLSNRPVVYYFFESLARPGDPWSARARSRLGRFGVRREDRPTN